MPFSVVLVLAERTGQDAPVLLAALAGLFGLLVGSFLNVVIARVPEGRSIVSPPSACPRCGHTLAPWENIPLVSWVVLRAKCHGCGLPISARYPAVELLNALLWAGLAVRVGWHPQLGAVLFLASASVALAAIDIETLRLPNPIVFTTQAAVTVLLVAAAITSHHLDRLATVAGGAALMSGVLFAIHLVSPRGMGFGDVKYAVALGAVLGWYGMARVGLGLFLSFLVGALVGTIVLVVRGRSKPFPFGPSLAAGTFLALAWGQPIIDWYRNLSS
jgi:leader peptidase (prepilin peptidase)/N-methyltransferase